MKAAIIGSRTITRINIEKYLPEGTTEIVSGGAKGVDALAKEYSVTHKIKITEFLPEYERYGKAAPLKRNLQIIESADLVIAFWDEESKGTKHVIESCKKAKKEIRVYKVSNGRIEE